MVRQPKEIGPRLEVLLDERDHLRVQLSVAKDDPSINPETVKAIDCRLWELDKEIGRNWGG